MEQPSARLIRRAARGEERALETLVRMYWGPIQGYLARMVSDEADAEDLAQEVFVRMARGLPDFAARSKFTTWLFQIAKNQGIDFLRRHEVERVPLERVPAGSIAADRPEYGVEETELLWFCIATLDVDLRSALILRDVHGFSYKEIAEIVDATLSTVKWRIYQARAQVHARYLEGSGAGRSILES